MTLSDLLGHLRARNGGPFFSEVAEAVDIQVLRYVRAERTYGLTDLTPEEIERLATYYHAPASELFAAREVARADLTSYLATCQEKEKPAHLEILGGFIVSGSVIWRDRHAVALRQPDNTSLVVYRSSVESWGDDDE